LASRLGKLIAEARLAQALSLRELARRIGKSPAYLVSLEQAEESPGASENTLKALASELGLDRDVLLALAQKTPKDLVPRSPTHIALYRLIRDLPAGKQEELRRQLEREARSRRDR
jgi:transcriptional regulator with XRE-family HTH domain